MKDCRAGFKWRSSETLVTPACRTARNSMVVQRSTTTDLTRQVCDSSVLSHFPSTATHARLIGGRPLVIVPSLRLPQRNCDDFLDATFSIDGCCCRVVVLATR